jgi:NAD(P)-dependent dehydrogenase (short-subunit alcohol dehydrogenase family)
MIEKITPLGRMGTAEDVANLVDFLTNDKSNFITGLSIPIDGGTHLLSQESITKIKF